MKLAEQITVAVTPEYIGVEERGTKFQHAFGYRVRINNLSLSTVQLLFRRWCIIDGNASVSEIEGEGVVGQQPVIMPQSAFEYTSWALIDTPSATMQGSYDFIDLATQQRFTVPIAPFALVRAGDLQ